MQLNEMTRKRLEWLSNAKPGDAFPDELFDSPDQNWGALISQTCKEALEHIDAQTAMLDAVKE